MCIVNNKRNIEFDQNCNHAILIISYVTIFEFDNEGNHRQSCLHLKVIKVILDKLFLLRYIIETLFKKTLFSLSGYDKHSIIKKNI